MSESGGKRWLAYGCFGCLGVLAILVVVALILAGTAWRGVQQEEITEQSLQPELPARVEPTPPDPAEIEAAPEATAGTPLPARTERAGTVVLDLSHGEFIIEPADPGEKLRIEATYDRASYELEETLDRQADSWSYEVKFRRTGSGLGAMLKQIMGGTSPRVEVYLPLDVPLELELKLTQGGSQVELGGLWLTSADIEFNQGGFQLVVDDPLREPMDSLRIHGTMGGFQAERLGNASPRKLDVDFSMGGMDLDLRGAWSADADVSIAFGMGGGAVRLPQEARIVGIPNREVTAPSDAEIRPPTLTFSVSGDLENLEIR